jgi:beta-glucosidase
MKKVYCILSTLASVAVLYAQTATIPGATIIDTVTVPVKIMSLLSITPVDTDTLYTYYGKVNYHLQIGARDSLNVGLKFAPVGGGDTVVPYQVSGDGGTRSPVNGINGMNSIYFQCSMNHAPLGAYTAIVTIAADTSRLEKTTDSLVGLMTNFSSQAAIQEMDIQLHGSGSRSSADDPALSIPGYYMTNGPQGICVGASGFASTFPSGAAQTCTFDTALIDSLGVALGEEAYAKGKYILEAPMINMVRDPRGGRDWETYGEDPYLAALLATAYCKGIQSVHCIAMPKHWICNDVETNRQYYSSRISERTLREIYAMPFEYMVKDAQVWSIMSAYNQVNGTYCCQDAHGLNGIVKNDWGFRGYICSDWNSMEENAVTTDSAANGGQDVEMPNAVYFGTPLVTAVTLGQVSPARYTDMVRRIVRAKVWAGVIGKLGNTVAQYSSDLETAAHQQLALQVAQKSIVLVQNNKFGADSTPVLPLNTGETIAILGPYGNYRLDAGASGATCPYYVISPDSGLRAAVPAGKLLDSTKWQSADVVIVMLGVSGEGEGSDRSTTTIEPPAGQAALVNTILAAGKKCVVVLTGGSAATAEAWANAPAIVVAWYPGEEQGHALAQILYGQVNPSGRLSATWPLSAGQLPTSLPVSNIINYERADTGRGYRYDDRNNLTPLYPFGHGLSYTTFQYSNIQCPATAYAGEDVYVTATIQNTGLVAGDEVAELYISEMAPPLPRPVKELRGFARVSLAPQQTQTVGFLLHGRDFAYFDTTAAAVTPYTPYGQFLVQPDQYTIAIGPTSAKLPLKATLTLQSPWPTNIGTPVK